MLNIAVCDDSRTDVEMLESAFDKLAQYQFSYEVYFTAKELLKHVIDDGECCRNVMPKTAKRIKNLS